MSQLCDKLCVSHGTYLVLEFPFLNYIHADVEKVFHELVTVRTLVLALRLA